MTKTWGVTNVDQLLEFKRDVLVAPKMLHEFALKNLENPNVFTLRYEDLVVNPGKT